VSKIRTLKINCPPNMNLTIEKAGSWGYALDVHSKKGTPLSREMLFLTELYLFFTDFFYIKY